MAVQTARLYLEGKGKELRLPFGGKGAHYYVPFTGKPGDYYDGYSLSRLIMGQIPSAAWAGKIVLIGPYAAALSDDYFTSASKALPMYRIEYQANVIESLLRENLKEEVSDGVQLAVLAVVCAAAAFVFFRRKIWQGGIVCASYVLFGFLCAYILYRCGLVVHVLWLPVAALALYLAALMDRFFETARERRALALEKERIATELSLATRIQASALPKTFPPFPDRHDFELYASMTPAREVGGDLYDFFLIDEDHLCLVIGDVAGKGVPASLFMMLATALIHHVAMHETSPAKILTSVNAEICTRNPAEMFVTVWLGVLELSTGVLKASSAGHEYPALKRADGSFELFKDKHSFVLGGMEGVRYKEYSIELGRGDKVFVYTDGVPEAINTAEEMFGTDRMIDALRANENGTPEDILRTVRRAVEDYAGKAEQFDDLTMLCVEYRGAPQE